MQNPNPPQILRTILQSGPDKQEPNSNPNVLNPVLEPSRAEADWPLPALFIPPSHEIPSPPPLHIGVDTVQDAAPGPERLRACRTFNQRLRSGFNEVELGRPAPPAAAVWGRGASAASAAAGR